jgi:hypothetical protein
LNGRQCRPQGVIGPFGIGWHLYCRAVGLHACKRILQVGQPGRRHRHPGTALSGLVDQSLRFLQSPPRVALTPQQLHPLPFRRLLCWGANLGIKEGELVV